MYNSNLGFAKPTSGFSVIGVSIAGITGAVSMTGSGATTIGAVSTIGSGTAAAAVVSGFSITASAVGMGAAGASPDWIGSGAGSSGGGITSSLIGSGTGCIATVATCTGVEAGATLVVTGAARDALLNPSASITMIIIAATATKTAISSRFI
ncbi:MAG: hypothetical protein ABSG92_00985 [Conexivisphaerales archaeon]